MRAIHRVTTYEGSYLRVSDELLSPCRIATYPAVPNVGEGAQRIVCVLQYLQRIGCLALTAGVCHTHAGAI